MAGLFKSGAMGDPDIVKTLAELVWKMWNEFLKKRIFEVNPRILLNFMLNSCWILSFCGLGLGSIFKLWNVLGGYLYLGPAPTKIWYPFIILCWTYVPAGTLLRLPEISRTCWVRPRRFLSRNGGVVDQMGWWNWRAIEFWCTLPETDITPDKMVSQKETILFQSIHFFKRRKC